VPPSTSTGPWAESPKFYLPFARLVPFGPVAGEDLSVNGLPATAAGGTITVMDLSQFHHRRTAIQGNARPGRAPDLQVVEGTLRDVLMDSGLFAEVEVERTDDPDQLVIALCSFDPAYTEADVAAHLERLWADRVRYRFWEAHALLTDEDHVEFEAASRTSPEGHYVTVHLVARKAEIPEQRAGSQGPD
jgi:hypothetical protein